MVKESLAKEPQMYVIKGIEVKSGKSAHDLSTANSFETSISVMEELRDRFPRMNLWMEKA